MCEPLHLIFIRHGHPCKPVDDSQAASNAKPLSDKGFDDAVAAGEWLLAQGIRPDLIVHTNKVRTTETAVLIQEVLGTSLAPLVVPGGFEQGADDGDILQRVDEWLRAAHMPPTCTVLFVGHHTQQIACLRELGGPKVADKARGAVLTYKLDDDGEWYEGPAHVGQ